MLQLPPLGQALLLLSLSPLSTPLLYCYLAYFVHINISRASWQRPQRPQPDPSSPLPAPPLCCTNSQVAKARGRIGCAFCGAVEEGAGKRGTTRVTWFDLYVQLCVCELVCVCVRRIFRISFLNYASFGLRHLSKYFRNAVSLLATPPSPLSIALSLLGIVLHTFCNYGSTSMWAYWHMGRGKRVTLV